MFFDNILSEIKGIFDIDKNTQKTYYKDKGKEVCVEL
jgi:hypothetical protein